MCMTLNRVPNSVLDKISMSTECSASVPQGLNAHQAVTFIVHALYWSAIYHIFVILGIIQEPLTKTDMSPPWDRPCWLNSWVSSATIHVGYGKYVNSVSSLKCGNRHLFYHSSMKWRVNTIPLFLDIQFSGMQLSGTSHSKILQSNVKHGVFCWFLD